MVREDVFSQIHFQRVSLGNEDYFLYWLKIRVIPPKDSSRNRNTPELAERLKIRTGDG